MSKSDKELNLATLQPQELYNMKKTIEQDMQALQGSFNELRVATSKFQESKNAIASFATQAPETEILVPLTSSLYIPGRVSDIENVIIDLGAGYFAEMPA